jgi:hypothetical protein
MVRGADAVSKSRVFEGRFGRMFRDLPAAEFGKSEQENITVLKKLGALMISQADVPEQKRNPEESRLPAGYTYLAQFIDHDITFDPASSLQRDDDPDALVDYRTPRFDLDSVYGRGPDDQPYLYRTDGVRLVLGCALEGGKDKRARDVLRNIPFNPKAQSSNPDLNSDPTRAANPDRNTLSANEFRAIIGDPRNDENVILAQLHAMVLRFHNQMATKLKTGMADVQQSVRWHYQWIILHDFLPRVTDKATYQEYSRFISPKSARDVQAGPGLTYYRPKNEAYIPIEFSAAAYRFGHSMVRRSYRLNRSSDPDNSGPFPILGKPDRHRTDNLRGFSRFFQNWAIDWDLFFDGLSPKAKQRAHTKNRVQPGYKIDTSLVEPLARLPFPFAKDMTSLPQRNLIRGWRLGLPSGQVVAREMGIKPLSDPKVKTVDAKSRSKMESIASIDPVFKDNAPLWFYILAEAQETSRGERLGPVGSRIIMETFVGLLLADPYSFLRRDPLWKPDSAQKGGKFEMAEFIREASRA